MSGYLDLRELAEEYADLKEREEDEDKINPLDDEEVERLAALKALEEQLFTDMEDYARNESTMIEDLDFEDYAQEFAADVGYYTDRDNNPLMNYIDWEAWAKDLLHDYTEVEFDGRTYYIRSY